MISPLLPHRGALVLSGAPGAGKTTVARDVAASLPRSAIVAGDDVSRMVASGWVGPIGEPADEAARQLLLRAQNICSLANNFSEAGFFPILDHVVPEPEVLGRMLEWLAPRPVLFVTLAPSHAVAVERNAARPVWERIDYDTSALHEQLAAMSELGWWLDTSALGATETVALILAEGADRAVVSSAQVAEVVSATKRGVQT
ncbi:MAG: ATP-binding protein [Humibacillus sp.]|nr:ATP-binding protein [Humibacillus sp.]MDN5778716.1 ATP-binding protein [Humibacillus sp.]